MAFSSGDVIVERQKKGCDHCRDPGAWGGVKGGNGSDGRRREREVGIASVGHRASGLCVPIVRRACKGGRRRMRSP